MSEQKSRGWLTLVYPESAREGWQNILAQIGQQCVISPLHDKDYNQGEENELKKPHYHVLLLWDGPTTFKNAKRVVELICGVGCFAAMSVRGSIRYFCHLDNPDKVQYDVKDLVQLGGIDIDDILLSKSDEDFMLEEIFRTIREFNFYIYADFIDWCSMNNKEWFSLIMHKHRENVFKYMRSIEYYGKDERNTTESDKEL